MPRQIARNFLPLARAMNRATWTDHREYRDGYAQRFVAGQEAKSDQRQAEYLAARRARLVDSINKAIKHPATYWNARYFRHLSASCVASTDEAVEEVSRMLCREIGRVRSRHWSANPRKVEELREALIFARYFRRFSRRVWLREAA